MVEKKTKATPAVETPEGPTAEELAAAQAQTTNWEFIDRIPSPEEVGFMLATLPNWWGVKPADYLDYVQALPSDKKIKVKVETPNGGTRKEERWFSVVTLYFSVAGRLQMLREAQELHSWRVEFVPEPTTPVGVPGFLQMDQDRIVYREYVEIWEPVGISTGQPLNRLPDHQEKPPAPGDRKSVVE